MLYVHRERTMWCTTRLAIHNTSAPQGCSWCPLVRQDGGPQG